MSSENIQVPGMPPINIQIGEKKKETIYSEKWMRKNIKNDDDLKHFIKSLLVHHKVVKGLFIPKNEVDNDSTPDKTTKKNGNHTDENDNTLTKIKNKYKKFFKFKYNIIKNEKGTLGVSIDTSSKDVKNKKITSIPEYLGANCLSSSKKNSISHPRKWKIQLICKFTDLPNTKNLLIDMENSNILSEDYSLLLSEELCDDNSGTCSITKEPSNEILQYYNTIIKNIEKILKDNDTLGDFFPTLIQDINLVVEGVPSVADIVVKLLSLSTFDKCEETELHRLLTDLQVGNISPDTPDNKAKIIILLSLYDNTVDTETIQQISSLITTPINQPDIMAIIRNYIQHITLNIKDNKIKELVQQIPAHLKEYQNNSSCRAKINEGVAELNKSISNTTQHLSGGVSAIVSENVKTFNDAMPESAKIIVESVTRANATHDDDHDNFVKSILALLNPKKEDSKEVSKKKEENGEKKTEEVIQEPFGENKNEENKTEEVTQEPFGELVIGKNNEPFGELVIGKNNEPFGELVIGKNNEPFGELVIGKNNEQFGELIIGKNNEPFGELVKGKNNDLTKSDFVDISPICKNKLKALISEYTKNKNSLIKYINKNTNLLNLSNDKISRLKKRIEGLVGKLYGIHRLSLLGDPSESCNAFPEWNITHKEWFEREKNEIQPIIDKYNMDLKSTIDGYNLNPPNSEEDDQRLDVNKFKFNGGKKNLLLEIGQNDIEYETI
jgi:protein-tyrosine-phosphatase